MKKLILKTALLVFPFFLIFLAYIITDPRKKIYHYDEYTFDYIMLNKGDVSTKILLDKVGKQHYDSFIFGSSRSCATRSDEWKKYLPAQNVPFSYSSWSESMEGIYRKIRLLDSLHIPIKNALIFIDATLTFDKNAEYDPVNSDHYLISGISKFEYYKSDFLDYLRNPRLIVTSIDYYLFKTQRGYMTDFVDPKYGGLNPVNCDWRIKSEQLIVQDSVSYYNRCKYRFYERPQGQVYAKKSITNEMQEYLQAIHHIFQKHRTNYKLIITPLYDQVKLNPEDMDLLKDLFGAYNIFDFSGINSITSNMYNYNEDVSHYRIRTGDYLLKKAYNNKSITQTSY